MEHNPIQWWRNGDHPQDHDEMDDITNEGKVVRYYRHPGNPSHSDHKCPHCLRPMHVHGWIDSHPDAIVPGQVVCPGDYVIEIDNEYFSIKANVYHAMVKHERQKS